MIRNILINQIIKKLEKERDLHHYASEYDRGQQSGIEDAIKIIRTFLKKKKKLRIKFEEVSDE